MPRHLWSVLCENSSIDKDTNLLSIFSILEEVTVTDNAELREALAKAQEARKGILLAMKISLVSFWTRTDAGAQEVATIRVRAVNPDGKEFSEPWISPLQLTSHKRMRLQLRFPGLVYFGPGDYRFKVEVEEEGSWLPVCEVPLEVKLVAEM